MKHVEVGPQFIHFRINVLSIFLTLAIHFPAFAITINEAHAMAEKYLDRPGAEIPHAPDLKCDLPGTFKYYKFDYDDRVSTPALCDVVSEYADHFTNMVLPFWPIKEDFGLLVRPISDIEEFNAAFEDHPPLNKMTPSKFHFLYLPGASVPPQKVVWSHEAGHAALQEVLNDHFYPIIRAAFIKRIENQALNTPGEVELSGLKLQLQEIHHKWNQMNSEEKEKAHKLEDSLGFRISALDNTLSIRDPSRSVLLVSFHEFFADLFAADLYKDLNIVGQAFDELGLNKFPSDYRRFDPKSKMLSTQGWSFFEPHILFAPARHYFGKRIAPNIKDTKLFMRELAQYFIKAVVNPNSSDFLSYQPIIEDVQKSQSPESVAHAIDSRQKTSELFSLYRYEQLENFCELNLIACKTEIINQLKRGQDGLFLTNINPEIANNHLIEAMEKIVQEIK